MKKKSLGDAGFCDLGELGMHRTEDCPSRGWASRRGVACNLGLKIGFNIVLGFFLLTCRGN
jgi:hypothetical protein